MCVLQFYPEDISLRQRVVPEDVAAVAAAFAVQSSSSNLLDSLRSSTGVGDSNLKASKMISLTDSQSMYA